MFYSNIYNMINAPEQCMFAQATAWDAAVRMPMYTDYNTSVFCSSPINVGMPDYNVMNYALAKSAYDIQHSGMGFGMGMPFGGLTQGITNTGSSTSTTTHKSPKQKKFEQNKQLLTKYAAELKKDESTKYEGQELENDIKEIVNDKEKSDAEKQQEMEALLDTYKDDIKEKAINDSKSSIKIDGKSLSDNLVLAGYEVDEHDLGFSISDLKSSIKDKDISKMQQIKASPDRVLEVLSAYNNDYDFMKDLVGAYAGIKADDGTQNKALFEALINDYKSALIKKAKDYKKDVKNASDLQDAIDKLDNLSAKNGDAFVKAFNELYVMTRLLAAKILADKVSKQVGDLFDKDEILNTVKEDLEKEGFSGLDVADNIELKNKNNVSKKETRNIDDKKPQVQLDSLLGKGRLEEVDEEDDDGNPIYKTTENVSGGKPKYYVLDGEGDDAEFYEVTKTSDGTWERAGVPTSASAIERSVLDAADANERAENDDKGKGKTNNNKKNKLDQKSEKVVEELMGQDCENLAETNAVFEDLPVYRAVTKGKNGKTIFVIVKEGKLYKVENAVRVNKDGNLVAAGNNTLKLGGVVNVDNLDIVVKEDSFYTAGGDVRNHVKGHTWDSEDKTINTILAQVNKDNVVDFIKGYYNAVGDSKKKKKKMLNHINDESRVSKLINKNNIKNVAKSFLARFEEDYKPEGARFKKLPIKVQNEYYKLQELCEGTTRIRRGFFGFHWRWGNETRLMGKSIMIMMSVYDSSSVDTDSSTDSGSATPFEVEA